MDNFSHLIYLQFLLLLWNMYEWATKGPVRGPVRGPRSPAAPNLPSDRQHQTERLRTGCLSFPSTYGASSHRLSCVLVRCGQKVGNKGWQTTDFRNGWCLGFDACVLAGTRQIWRCSYHQLRIERKMYHSQRWPSWGGRIVIMSKAAGLIKAISLLCWKPTKRKTTNLYWE